MNPTRRRSGVLAIASATGWSSASTRSPPQATTADEAQRHVTVHKDIYECLAEMRPYAAQRRWSELEDVYRRMCEHMAGAQQASRIAALDFQTYELALQAALVEASIRLAESNVQALYFEYDLDNGWESAFFICAEYNAEHVGDDDWVCDWVDHWLGPSFEEASELYVENHFDRTPVAKGSTLYLVARTVAAFGRSLDQIPLNALAVCIGFHDQDPVMRVREAASGGR